MFKMEFPVVGGLVLSLVVLYWPGQPTPQWLRDWLNRLWLVLGITFLAGTVLSFYNMTSKPLAGGGIQYSTARHPYIDYALIAIFIPLMLLTLLGAAYVVVSVARGWSVPRAQEAWHSATAGVQFRRLWASLAVALCALAVGVTFGAPVVVTNEGISDPLGIVINGVTTVVFLTALASAWSAVKPTRGRQ
jgi:hypothetical protein